MTVLQKSLESTHSDTGIPPSATQCLMDPTSSKIGIVLVDINRQTPRLVTIHFWQTVDTEQKWLELLVSHITGSHIALPSVTLNLEIFDALISSPTVAIQNTS